MLTVTDFANRSTWKVIYTKTTMTPDGPATSLEEGINVIADDVIEAAMAVIEHVTNARSLGGEVKGVTVLSVQIIGSGDDLIVAGVE